MTESMRNVPDTESNLRASQTAQDWSDCLLDETLRVHLMDATKDETKAKRSE